MAPRSARAVAADARAVRCPRLVASARAHAGRAGGCERARVVQVQEVERASDEHCARAPARVLVLVGVHTCQGVSRAAPRPPAAPARARAARRGWLQSGRRRRCPRAAPPQAPGGHDRSGPVRTPSPAAESVTPGSRTAKERRRRSRASDAGAAPAPASRRSDAEVPDAAAAVTTAPTPRASAAWNARRCSSPATMVGWLVGWLVAARGLDGGCPCGLVLQRRTDPPPFERSK